MSKIDLTGPLLKLERAKVHIAELERAIEAFETSTPHEIKHEQLVVEGDTVECVVTVKIERQPPAAWGLVLGDAVQNIRIALDYIAWELTPEADRDCTTAYPICLTPAKFRKAAKRIASMQPNDQTFVEKTQPYHWPDPASDPLAMLAELSNRDKHRLLIPVATGRSGTEWVGSNVTPADGSFRITRGPLIDGATVMRFRARPEVPGTPLILTPVVELGVVIPMVPDLGVVDLLNSLHNRVRFWMIEQYFERGYMPA